MNKREELEAMLAGVDRLADSMKVRLRAQRAKGRSGGLRQDMRAEVAAMMREHVDHIAGCRCCGANAEKNDDTFAHAVDIANLAMMLGLQDERRRQ